MCLCSLFWSAGPRSHPPYARRSWIQNLQKPALPSVWFPRSGMKQLLKHIPWVPLSRSGYGLFHLPGPGLCRSGAPPWSTGRSFPPGTWMQNTLRSLAEENTPILFPPVLTPLTELLLPPFYVRYPVPHLAETERDLETAGSAAAAEILRGTEPMAAAEGLETAEHVAASEILKRH